MLRLSFCLVLLALIFGLVSAEYSQQYEVQDQYLIENENMMIPIYQKVPTRPRGNITVTVVTDYTLLVCLQENLEIVGDLSACNPSALFNFSRTNHTASTNFLSFSFEEQSVFDDSFLSAFLGNTKSTSSQSTTLRAYTDYNLIYGFSDLHLPDNATVSLFVYFDDEGCNDPQIGLPNGSCYSVPDVPNTKVTVPALDSKIYVFNVTKQQNQFLNITLGLSDEDSFSEFYSEDLLAVTTNPNITVSIRREAVPDGDINDGSVSLTNGTSVSLLIPTPAPGSYYIQISNNAPAVAFFHLSANAAGCPSGQVGPTCNSTFIDLTNNITVIERVGSNDYDYYTVTNYSLVVGVGTKKLKDVAPSLLVSTYNFPQYSTAIAQSVGHLVNFISANYSLSKTVPTYYISVWAEEGTTYYIWANNYCPNNCEGSGSGINASTPNITAHGQCNIYTGTCDCDSGYSGLFCDRSRLAAGWIVLLIIGPAIILAIAIGVPVACFLRNKRRAQYERV